MQVAGENERGQQDYENVHRSDGIVNPRCGIFRDDASRPEDAGATSFWEDFDLAWTNNAFRIDEMPVAGKKDVHGDYGAYCYVVFRHSLCHGWSSGPAPWLVEHVLGIRPLDVGCRIIEVKPDLGDLEWAEGAMALPGGRSVRVRVSRCRDGTLKVEVDAPDGIKVVVPGQGSISAEGR